MNKKIWTMVAILAVIAGFFTSSCTFLNGENTAKAKVYDVADTLHDNLKSILSDVSPVVKIGPVSCQSLPDEQGESSSGVYWSASFTIEPLDESQMFQFTKDILTTKGGDMNLVVVPGMELTAGDNNEQYNLYMVSDLYPDDLGEQTSNSFLFEASTGCFPEG